MRSRDVRSDLRRRSKPLPVVFEVRICKQQYGEEKLFANQCSTRCSIRSSGLAYWSRQLSVHRIVGRCGRWTRHGEVSESQRGAVPVSMASSTPQTPWSEAKSILISKVHPQQVAQEEKIKLTVVFISGACWNLV